MDKYKIDGQKLSFHPARVLEWQRGEQIYPIYVEISPSGACNHRCIFCALDFMGYKQNFIETKRLKTIISAMSTLGVKSIMFGGEGEPLIHPDIVEIIRHTKEVGIDVALTTNGVLLTEEVAEEILPYLSWIKISLDAGTSSTYSKIHRTKAEDYFTVMRNIVIANGIKAIERYRCAIGVQAIMIEENESELELFVKKAKAMGIDYTVLKRYSQHGSSKNTCSSIISNRKYQDLSTDKFSVIVRDGKQQNYTICRALPFWSYISSNGDVWGCSAHIGNKKFLYGNIYSQCIDDIWWDKEENIPDVSTCRPYCRMNKCNEYLEDLVDGKHNNFI